MKKIIPFVKEIRFKTMISKITSISLEHTLRVEEDNLISGNFILEGTYKMTQASQIDEDFAYKIPVDIEIDDKYDASNINLDIDDFTYEILDEEKLKLNIALCIDNLEEKEIPLLLEEEPVLESFDVEVVDERKNNEEEEIVDDLFLDTSKKEELIITENLLNNKEESMINNNIDAEVYNNSKYNNISTSLNDSSNVDSLFASFKDSAETFKTYYVYIVKEEDTVNSILSKYNITKEELEDYNNLEDIKTGSKIVVPCSKNE